MFLIRNFILLQSYHCLQVSLWRRKMKTTAVANVDKHEKPEVFEISLNKKKQKHLESAASKSCD